MTQLVHSPEPPHATIKLETSGSADSILNEVRGLHTADKKAEAAKKFWGNLGAIGLVVGFLAMFFGFMMMDETPLGLLVGGGVIGFSILSLIIRSVKGAADIDDRKLDVVRGVLMDLGPELKTNRPINLSLDFRGYDRTRPTQDSTGFFTSSGEKTFQKRWLRMSMMLMDGTRVMLTATEHCKRKEKRKRKYTKMKDRLCDEVSVELYPPKGKSLRARPVPNVVKNMQPRLLGVRVKPRLATFRFRTAPGLRLRGRGGWSAPERMHNLLNRKSILSVLIVSYRCVAT